MVPAPMTRFAEFFRSRLTAEAVALGLICVLSLGAQGLGWLGAKDSVDLLVSLFAPLSVLLAIVWQDFRQAWRKLLHCLSSSSKRTFLFSEIFRFRLTAGAVALGLICILSLAAQGLGWSGAKDSVDLLAGFFAPLLFLLAIVWRDFRQAWRKLLQGMLSSSKRAFLLVFDPLFFAAIGAQVAARVAALAMAPPLPRIVDVNLTPRLLPIPRALMGAAI